MTYLFTFLSLCSMAMSAICIYCYTPQNSVLGLLAVIGMVMAVIYSYASYKETQR